MVSVSFAPFQVRLQLVFFSLFTLTLNACDGDARIFTESVESADLDLISMQVEPPTSAISPLYINSNEQLQLSIRGMNSNAQAVTVPVGNRRWTSSDSTVLTVSDSGLVTGRVDGAADVSVQIADLVSSTLTINVSDAKAQAITEIVRLPSDDSQDAELPENGSILNACVGGTFAASALYTDDTTRRLGDVAWDIDALAKEAGAILTSRDSLDEGTVEVIGRAAGDIALEAVLPATFAADDMELSLVRTLTVSNTLESVTISEQSTGESGTITIEQGDPSNLVASGQFSMDGETRFITAGALWTVTEGSSIISLGTAAGDNPGQVRGLATGTATVRASCGEGDARMDDIIVVVVNSSGALSFEQGSSLVLSLSTGGRVQLELSTGTTYDIDRRITEGANWSSSDDSVLTVSNAVGSKGEVEAVSVGTATVTATSGDLTETISIRVDR